MLHFINVKPIHSIRILHVNVKGIIAIEISFTFRIWIDVNLIRNLHFYFIIFCCLVILFSNYQSK
jgi:hypothetical protein